MSAVLDFKLPQNLLAGKSNAELTKLSEDNSKLVEFFSTLTLQDLENAKRKKEEIVGENKRLAESTFGLKSQFESLKAQLVDKSQEATTLKSDYDKRFSELKSFSRNDHASILKALQQAKKTEEQNSETLVDSFLSGKQGNSVEDFVQQYLSSRKLYWLRKTKADKLELIKPKAAPRGPKNPPPSKSMSLSQEPPAVANPQQQPPYPGNASMPKSMSMSQEPPAVANQQQQPPYPSPMASLPSFPPASPYGGAPPTQSLNYGRPPAPHPHYPPQGSFHVRPPYPPGPYAQMQGPYPPPNRPYSQPYPYSVYQPPGGPYRPNR